MSLTLQIKSLLVNSPLEGFAKLAQDAASFGYRRAHPELTELFLEEKRLPRVLARLIKADSNTLDVGCHLGSFLSQLKRIAPQGQHVAIEASPRKAEWLRRRFPDAVVEQVAVADYEGVASFEDNMDNPGFSKLAGASAPKGRVQRYDVNVTTLDAMGIHHRVEFVKIDIEGAELAAMKGGKKFFAANRPSIIFECGADANADLNRRDLFDYMTGEMRYEIYTFADFLYSKGPIGFDEFRKCGIYPFRAFNFVALPRLGDR